MSRRTRFLIIISLAVVLTLTVWISSAHRPKLEHNQPKASQVPQTEDPGIHFDADWPFCPCNRSALNGKNVTTFHWCSQESTQRGFNQNVIAYSLYGKYKNEKGIKSKYFSVLDLIPQQARDAYPGWQIRVYHDIGVDRVVERKLLCDMYCNNDNVDLCDVTAMRDSWEGVRKGANQPHPITNFKKMNRMVWRNLPLLDDQVDKLMVRDLDSEINSRELAAVQQWFQSNYTFHVMRDHQHHCKPQYKIMGGLFGIKIHQRRDLIQGLATIFTSKSSKEAWGEDQILLTEIFWPIVRQDAMIHDSYCCELDWDSLPATYFPTKRENLTFASDRNGSTWTKVVKCPQKCRPPNHKDWEYC